MVRKNVEVKIKSVGKSIRLRTNSNQFLESLSHYSVHWK